MGIHQKQGEFWAEPVELARRIPAEHPLRRMDRVLRLDFVRFEVAGKHGTRGNVPVDPAIIMRLMLLLFLDDVRSERELMRVLPLRIDYLWFPGCGLDDEVRTMGESLGIHVRGSLGVVLFAAASGHLDKTARLQTLDGLETQSTLWMSAKVKVAARQAVSELFGSP